MRDFFPEWRTADWPMNWNAVFGRTAPRTVEVGFGNGEFLVDLARSRPDEDFLGIEIAWGSVTRLLRRIENASLTNVRVLQGDGAFLLARVFPPESLTRVVANNSDPWPKDRHARRRVIQPPFARAAAACLKPGGVLHVATDDVPYAAQIDEVLRGEAALLNLNAPDAWLDEVEGRLQTGYEEDWRAAGRPLHFFEYARPLEGGPVDTSMVAGEARAERSWPVKTGRP